MLLIIGRPPVWTDPCKSSTCFAPRARCPRPSRLLAQRAAHLDLLRDKPSPPRRTAPPLARTVCPRPDSCLPLRPRSICLALPRSIPSTSSTLATSAPLHGIELHVGVKLCVDEPSFAQAASRCYAESACCNIIFQVFQMFQSYIASVVYWCCKSRSGCCTCYNSYTCMVQVYVLNV
jgi:hypothetical protein